MGRNSGAPRVPNDATNRVRSPSTRRICASVDSQSRAAVAATTSKTGWISVGEPAMTPRISLVAVCCSNDSFNSLNNRTFSMAITAWSAKVSSSLICAGVKGAHLGATRAQRSNEFPLLTKRSRQEGGVSAPGTYRWEIVLRADLRNVERAMLAHPVILWLINTDLRAGDGHGTKMSPHSHSVALPESQLHVINSTHPCRALDDGVEDRLHI